MNKFQLDTFAKVNNLKEQLEQEIDPTRFVLNPNVEIIQNQIFELQNKCEHIYENGVCVVCGKEEK